MSAGIAQSNNDGRIHVKVLGGLQVRRGETVLGARDLGGCKPRQVLEILVLHRGTPVSKDRLIDMIWGDAAPPEALPTLESYISILRRRIQPGNSKFGPLRTVTSGYVMDRDQLDLDLDRFNSLLEQAQHVDAANAYPFLLQALAIAAEPLLADEPSAGWAEQERQDHASRLNWAIVAAANAAAALGETDDAILLARRALSGDGLDETAWCALLGAFQRAGRHADALHAYERCRRLFIDELGCAPGPALQKIHQDLLQGASDSDGDLSDLLSALLCLHAHTTPTTDVAPANEDGADTDREPLRDASRLLSKLVKQAQFVLQSPM